MAHPKCFVVKSGVLPHKKSRLLYEINLDKVKATPLTRDGLDALRHKQQLKMRGRKSFILLNEMTGKARAESEKRSLDKKAKTPPATDFPSATSTPSLVDSKRRLVDKRSSTAVLPIPHGFRFHSNGDERLPHRSSLGAGASRQDLERFKQNSGQMTAPVHPRYRDGRYSHNPVVETLVWKDLRRPRFTDSSSEINMEFENSADYLGGYNFGSRRASEPIITGYSTIVRDKSRHVLARDNLTPLTKDFSNVSWQVPLRQTKSDLPLGNRRSSDVWSRWSNQGLPYSSPNLMLADPRRSNPQLSNQLFKGIGFVHSEPAFLRMPRSVRNPALMPAQSSFNRKYGVSLKLLAKRKPILDGLKDEERKQASETMDEVEKYVEDIQKIVKERTQKKPDKDPLLSLEFISSA